MSTDEYVPSEDEARGYYRRGAWLAGRTTTPLEPQESYAPRFSAEFDRFLARVRRDAKAEALREAAPLMHDYHDAAWLETQATEYETGGSDEHR